MKRWEIYKKMCEGEFKPGEVFKLKDFNLFIYINEFGILMTKDQNPIPVVMGINDNNQEWERQ